MRSVADVLRREDREALAALGPGELAQTPPLAPDDADRLLRRRRQRGRRPSRCLVELIG
jgi:hypothetical protein